MPFDPKSEEMLRLSKVRMLAVVAIASAIEKRGMREFTIAISSSKFSESLYEIKCFPGNQDAQIAYEDPIINEKFSFAEGEEEEDIFLYSKTLAAKTLSLIKKDGAEPSPLQKILKLNDQELIEAIENAKVETEGVSLLDFVGRCQDVKLLHSLYEIVPQKFHDTKLKQADEVRTSPVKLYGTEADETRTSPVDRRLAALRSSPDYDKKVGGPPVETPTFPKNTRPRSASSLSRSVSPQTKITLAKTSSESSDDLVASEAVTKPLIDDKGGKNI